MKSLFFPIRRYKTITTLLTGPEIQKKLDKLNFQYKNTPDLPDNRFDYISYFPGERSFNAERTYKGIRNGTFYIDAYGSIYTKPTNTVITIEYVLDNPYLRMYLSVYFGFMLFAWIFVLFFLIEGIKHDDYSVLVLPAVSLFFSIVPFLLKLFYAGDIYTFHSKILVALNKKG